MERIHVVGGRPLRGSVRIHGGKNAVLPILAATAATNGRFRLYNCPEILDVEVTLRLLEMLGVESRREDGCLVIESGGAVCDAPDPALAGRLRASVLLLGALLSAKGSARIPLPGGCVLGARPLDLHVDCLRALGVEIRSENNALLCRGRPEGGTVFLRYPSVGATENLLLAAVGAKGPVRILGAAREPEITELAAFLSACGAEIRGAGTQCLQVRPAPLHGADHSVAPDRIEAATYLCAAACTGGRITLEQTDPAMLQPVLSCLRRAGCSIETGERQIRLSGKARQGVGPIVTGPYPAFPTDAQAPVMAALATASGVTLIEETVFENRFRHVPALRAMGAQIDVAGQTARIRGVPALHGARVSATDLRGGAAMLLAALGASGESQISGAGLLRRGYQDLTKNLRALGAELSVQTITEKHPVDRAGGDHGGIEHG